MICSITYPALLDLPLLELGDDLISILEGVRCVSLKYKQASWVKPGRSGIRVCL